MAVVGEKVAELVGMLPMFTGTLLEGIEIRTPIKLSISEEKTLMFLYKHEGKSMTAYSKKVGLTRGSFTAVADRLEDKGLIERTSVCDDRRKNALILTKEGKSIAKIIDRCFKQHIASKVELLDAEDLKSLKNALETIVSTIDKLK
ncbi:MAG: MarR family transcriptional regulator [Firmicutes bacterium]|nr:MarR family transcriptional regulator [Bacillota bacterium]